MNTWQSQALRKKQICLISSSDQYIFDHSNFQSSGRESHHQQIDYFFVQNKLMDKIVSHFAEKINFPICKFLDEVSTWPINTQKQPISFLSGDPTVYGQFSFQMPERGYEILRESIKNEDHHGYCGSTGIPELRAAVKKLYKPNFEIDLSDIHINHGVNMGLLACLMAFTNEDDQILVPQMGYPFFKDVCPALRRRAVAYKLKKESNFEIDLQHASTLITQKTAFMYIINPTNPMGTVFTRQHMLQILDFANKHEVPLVVDEVYFKMVFPGVDAPSFGELTEDVPVVVLCGVQKILSVPGWVQSWMVIFDKHKVLNQIKHNLQVLATIFLHTNVFTQHALPKIIDELGIFTSQKMEMIQSTYEKIFKELSSYHGTKPLPAQGTIYLTVEINLDSFSDISSDIQFVKKIRQEEAVNLLPLSIMGTGCIGFRLLTCGKEQLYHSFYQRLSSFILRHKK